MIVRFSGPLSVTDHSLVARPGDGPLVLVADDDEDQHRLCDEYFPSVGLVVTHARTAAECFALIQESTPDVLVVNPRVRGPFTTATLREIAELGFDTAGRLLVVTSDVVCAHPGALPVSIAGCIVKPISLRALAARVLDLATRKQDEPAA